MNYLAYFYDPSSVPRDGWRDRLTVPCTPCGKAITRRDFDAVSRLKYIGHYKIGSAPEGVWDEARVTSTKS